MSNLQVRLLAASIAMIAGALAAGTDNLNVNVGLVIIILSGAIFFTEYVRARKNWDEAASSESVLAGHPRYR